MKKIKFCLLFVLLFTTMLLVLTLSAAAEDTIHSGTWGNLTWELNKTTGVLTISGEGAMNDFSSSSTGAWQAYPSSIKSVTINEGVTSIGKYAFYGCSGLERITVESGNTVYHSAGNCLIETASKTLIVGCKNSVIPTDGSVTSIGDYAFYDCSGLTSITIPSSVTSIGSSAFSGCSGLTSITIPSSVTSIGEYAFSGCSGLTEVHITDLAAWCNIYFERSSYYSSTCFSNPLLYAQNLYLNGNQVTSLEIPNKVTHISSFAFYNCNGLTSITIPESVTSIGDFAFYDCSGLESITVVSGNTKYHSAGNCLIETASKTLVLGCKNSVIPTDGSVTSIGSSAFEDCSGLTSIIIPASVTNIATSAFEYCTMLETITFAADSQCTTISQDAFYGCSALTSITIPSNVTSIGSEAFYNCASLEGVALLKNISHIYANAFNNPDTVFFCEYDAIPKSWSSSWCSNNNHIMLDCDFLTENQAEGLNADFLEVHITNKYSFTGSTIQPEFLVTYKNVPLQQGTDFIFYIYNNLNASGSAVLSICGIASYTGLLKTFDFVIEAADISNYTVSIPDVVFYGAPCFPSVVVKNGDFTLTEGMHYSVIIYNNTQPGTGLVKIIGIGNYRGCIDTTFSILPAAEANIFTDDKIQIPSAQDLYRIPLNTSLTLESLTTLEQDFSSLAPTIEYSWSFYTPFNQTSSRSSKSTSYRFTHLGLYTVTLAVTITTYTYEYQYHGSQAFLTKVPHPSTTTTTLSIQVVTEPIAPQQLIADPPVPFGLEHAFLSVSTETPYATIGEIQWSSSDSTVISVDQNGMITYHKPGTATITATTEFGAVSWEIENMALDLSLYGKIVSYDPQNNAIDVYFGNSLLTKDKDFTLTVDTYDNNISRLTIAGCNLFVGVISIPYSHETNRFYSCEHECQTWQKVDASEHAGICMICRDPLRTSHNWNGGAITTPATHTTLGVKTYTCTDCGEAKTEDIPKLTAHEYGEWQKYDITQHKRTCPCTEVEYDDHHWNDGEVTTQPTHMTLGVKTYACSDCGETYTEDVEKLTTHEYSDWQKDNNARHKRVCPCSKVMYAGHKWNDGVVTTPSTHTMFGVKTFTCTDCGETKTENVAKDTTHTYGDWVTVEEAQIGKEGKKEQYCACGKTITEIIPALTDSSNAKGESLGTGAAIGIVGGSVAVVGGGGFCLYWFVLRKKRLLK